MSDAKQIAADIVSAACTVAFNRSSVLGYGEPNTLREDIEKAILAEREACAALVHDRLGADGYGVAQMIRARGEKR